MENNTNEEQMLWILSLRSTIISAESKCKCWDYATFCGYLLFLPSQYPSLLLEIIPWFSFGSHLYPPNQSTWFRYGWSYPWLQERSHEWAQQINKFYPTEHRNWFRGGYLTEVRLTQFFFAGTLWTKSLSLKLLCTPIDKASPERNPFRKAEPQGRVLMKASESLSADNG